MEHRYEIVVENLGTVYRGSSFSVAKEVFENYKEISRHGTGRAGNTLVTLLGDNDIIMEYDGRALEYDGRVPPAEVERLRLSYDDEDRKGTVIVKEYPYGPEIVVIEGDTTWTVSIDLFHLVKDENPDDENPDDEPVRREDCLQLVAYATDGSGDPLIHVRIYRDGTVDTFRE